MTDPISIRVADASDAALLATLGADLFAQTFATRNTPEDLRSYLSRAFGEATQRQELEDESMRTWIAGAEDGSPVGYIQLRLDAAPAGVQLRRPAELARLYVDQRWHGA